MTLRELADFYVPYREGLLARTLIGSPERNLRTNAQRRLREGFQAYFFGSIYGALFGCRDILTIHVREVADRDSLVQWRNGHRIESLNLQLKELVSPNLNPKAESAEQELQKILDELPRQYGNAGDLTVAIFMSYGHAHVTNVYEPQKLNLAALWFFGFSKDQYQELFLIGGRTRNQHDFRLRWRASDA